MIEPRTPDSVKVIRVIEVKAARGAGTEDDPVRIVVQLWSFDGKLLAEDDCELTEELAQAQADEYIESEYYAHRVLYTK